MLVVAALVPDTALLVPGAAGATDVLTAVRAAALDAVAEVVAAGVDTVVVVAPGPVPRELAGTVLPSLGAAGIPAALVPWPAHPMTLPGAGNAKASIPSTVALHLLARAGRRTGLRVVEVTAAQGRDALAGVGRDLVRAGRTGFVVVGSSSGRNGPRAPLAEDPRAADHDARVLADLAGAGAPARARLAADDPVLADELAVRGWAPWQVLLGAAGSAPVRATLLARSAELGTLHAALLWDAR